MYNNNSRQQADSIILDSLRGAGSIGLHINDIIPLTGLRGRKPTLQRLFALQKQGKTEQLPGQKWRINITPSAIIPHSAPVLEPYPQTYNNPDASSQSCNTNQTNSESSNTLQANSESYNSANLDAEMAEKTVEVPHSLPQIQLPGKPKFTSYKNALQEYCQKLAQALPQYHTIKQPDGPYLAKVSFGTNVVLTQRTMPNQKDAENLAAFESLKQLGYFSEEIQFEHTKILKRKNPNKSQGGSEAKVARVTSDGLKFSLPDDLNTITSFKSLLNEVAQKNQAPTPLYQSVAVDSGFLCTVTFRGRDFKGTKTFSKKKDAEQNAARCALHVLIGLPLAEHEQVTESRNVTADDINHMISAARKVKIQKEMKTRLQEYSQKTAKKLPVYTTEIDDVGNFLTRVNVVDKEFVGQIQKSKKLSERSAAEVALKSLGLLAEEIKLIN